MKNKYPAQCYICRKEVKAGDGHFERNGKGGWQVRHVECASEHYLKKKNNVEIQEFESPKWKPIEPIRWMIQSVKITS